VADAGHDVVAKVADADSVNKRPRKTLGCMKPSDRLAELLALTA
jgi:hypothetical protein